MNISIALRFRLISVYLSKKKEQLKLKKSSFMKVKATLNQCFGECKLAQHCANQRGVSSKTISPDSIFHSWVYTEKSQSCFYTHVYHCRIHKKQVIKPALVLTNIRMVEEK
jgi:hypothetical protein